MVERKITTRDLPISTALGVLGHTGITAYFALLDVGQPRPGTTVLVSTAAGSVSSCAGQMGVEPKRGSTARNQKPSSTAT